MENLTILSQNNLNQFFAADELNLLENIKRELRAEVRRRRMLAEEAQQRLLD